MNNAVKHYVYRLDHDTGFAPHVDDNQDICILSGCKKTTIEIWARPDSWIIGIGGNKTGRGDRIIYAMEVEKNLLYPTFKAEYPKESLYLSKAKAGTNVLIARKFYYFGDKAFSLPIELSHIIHKGRHCKCAPQKDINLLKEYLLRKFGKEKGKFGNPNN